MSATSLRVLHFVFSFLVLFRFLVCALFLVVLLRLKAIALALAPSCARRGRTHVVEHQNNMLSVL